MKPSDRWALIMVGLVGFAILHAWAAATLAYFGLTPFASVAGGISFLSLFPGCLIAGEMKPSRRDDEEWEKMQDAGGNR